MLTEFWVIIIQGKIYLFQRKLIEHTKSKHARLGSFRGKGVHHYFNPETKLNIMNG